MTFSIVACDEARASFGVAVASRFLAVGAAVPAVALGAGALATQSVADPAHRSRGLALLGGGGSAATVVQQLIATDARREDRQLGVVAPDGSSAAFTGARCEPWAGSSSGDGYAISGNTLVGEAVVAEVEARFLAGRDQPLAWRLLRALRAGDAAGGDRRGRQSAALLVVAPGAGAGGQRTIDLRVDDHPDPLVELARLLALSDFYNGTADPAALLPLEGALLAEVADLLAARGHGAAGAGADATRDALARWAELENLEARLVSAALIDPAVLAYLRRL